MMRVNINVPYSKKDQVKALGARWDVARKTWYVVDPQDLTIFAPYLINKTADNQPACKNTKIHKFRPPPPPTNHKPRVDEKFWARTGLKIFTPLCNCTTPPWEECEHTDLLAEQAMQEMLNENQLHVTTN